MPQNPIQSVERALDILEYIAKHNGAGVTEISKSLNLNKSTTFGLIKTLAAKGYVYKSPTAETYHPTIRLHTLASYNSEQTSLVEIARPFLEDLLKKYGETVHLVDSTDTSVVYIAKLEGTKSVRVHTKVGDTLPLHCTGLGKVILAWRSAEEVAEYARVSGLPAMTPHTIVDLAALQKELSKTRQQGYAIDDEEVLTDIYCVAVPVHHQPENVRYAISIAMPKFRSEPGLTRQMAADLTKTAVSIEKSI